MSNLTKATNLLQQALKEINIDLPEGHTLSVLHPAEQMLLQFMRKELIFGEIKNLKIANGLPNFCEYAMELGIIKRKKFLTKED